MFALILIVEAPDCTTQSYFSSDGTMTMLWLIDTTGKQHRGGEGGRKETNCTNAGREVEAKGRSFKY